MNRVEPFMTFKQAAGALGVPYFKIQRAAKSGSIPTYSLHNKRKLVRLSDIVQTMSAQSVGSGK